MGAHLPPPPPAAVSRILSRFDRDQLAGFIAIAIDLLDVAEGDADVEANGDELDGTAGEDDFFPHSQWKGEPGCPIADPDCCAVRDDIGTDHIASRKLGFDPAPALADEDNEEGQDAEAVNEDGSDAVLDTLPRYALDQRPGPINYRDGAVDAHGGYIRAGPLAHWRLEEAMRRLRLADCSG